MFVQMSFIRHLVSTCCALNIMAQVKFFGLTFLLYWTKLSVGYGFRICRSIVSICMSGIFHVSSLIHILKYYFQILGDRETF